MVLGDRQTILFYSHMLCLSPLSQYLKTCILMYHIMLCYNLRIKHYQSINQFPEVKQTFADTKQTENVTHYFLGLLARVYLTVQSFYVKNKIQYTENDP